MKSLKAIGEMLVEARLLTPEQLKRALDIQRGEPMGNARLLVSILVDERMLSEKDALPLLTEQFGVPHLDVARVAIDLAALDWVPEEFAFAKRVLPILAEGEQLFVAMADPMDAGAIAELEFGTGRKVRAYVSLASALVRATHQAFAAKASGASHYFGPAATPEQRSRVASKEPHMSTGAIPVPIETVPVIEVDGPPEGLGPDDWSSMEPLPIDERAGGTKGKKLVLVVEDDAEIRKLLVRLAEERGHTTIEADTGPKALERVRQKKPDLLLLDAMLPEVHGFEVARRLRTSGLSDIPIIMLSAVHRGWRVAADAKANLGVDYYFEKPFRIVELAAAMDHLLEKVAPRSAKDPEAVREEAKDLIRRSAEAQKAGQPDAACTFLQEAIAIDPLAFRPHFHLGLLYVRLERWFDAMTSLEAAVEIHPKSFLGLKNLALVYEQAGFRNKAIEAWERALPTASDEVTQERIRARLLNLLS